MQELSQEEEVLMPRLLSYREQDTIVRAAALAFAGKHDEAEATRFGANYHGLDTRPDADIA